MPEYKLHYFNLYGRGEPLRMMLHKAGADWEDARIQDGTWPTVKPTMPNGVVPCLELADGTKMGETVNVARYLGVKLGFYPEDPREAQRCDELVDAFKDVEPKVFAAFFAKGEAQEKLIAELFDTHIPTFLKQIDSHFTTSKFLVSDNLTVADFMIGGWFCNMFTNPGVGMTPEKFKGVVDTHANFKAYGERFSEELKGWLDSRAPSHG